MDDPVHILVKGLVINNVDSNLKIFDQLPTSLTSLLHTRMCSNVGIWLTPPFHVYQRSL